MSALPHPKPTSVLLVAGGGREAWRARRSFAGRGGLRLAAALCGAAAAVPWILLALR